MAEIRRVVEKYPYVAMDTEFPGVVARPLGQFRSSTDYHYQTLRCNADLLKVIQIGFCFTDGEGNAPPSGCGCWQFNLKFDRNADLYAQDSMQLLDEAGLEFDRHKREGIDVEYFGELLVTSGIVLNDEVRWLTFHSGYDFGYLLRVLHPLPMPTEEHEFFALLVQFFPCIYDIKYMIKCVESMPGSEKLKGGLNKIADQLQVKRFGQMHQAGSDSVLTAATFFKVKTLFFDSPSLDKLQRGEDGLLRQCVGVLFGFSSATIAAEVH